MPDKSVDVLLITSDRTLADLVARHKPDFARIKAASATNETTAEQVHPRQVWIDLQTTPCPPSIKAERHVYFYSGVKPAVPHLPLGIFIRKPFSGQVLEVLWAGVPPVPDSLPADQRCPAGRSLPPWLLDFQELGLAPLCRKLVTGLGPRLGYRTVSLYLHDFERHCLTLVETQQSRPVARTLPLDAVGQHLMVAVARSGRVFCSDHTSAELAARGLPLPTEYTYDDDACLIAPLCSDGQLWGVLNFSGRAGTALTDEKPALDEIFAFLGRALCHACAYDQARIEARVDSLTGLYNQRWITESLTREIRRAERFGTPLSVLMIDLDGLKAINDREGHAAGDCALRHMASRITRILRQFDGAARVGGDEFVIMLPGTNLKGAQHVAQRLLNSIREHSAEYRARALPITASIGEAEWQSGWNALQLLDQADRAMYRAKQNGRNGRDPRPETSPPVSAPPAAPAENPTRTVPRSRVR